MEWGSIWARLQMYGWKSSSSAGNQDFFYKVPESEEVIKFDNILEFERFLHRFTQISLYQFLSYDFSADSLTFC